MGLHSNKPGEKVVLPLMGGTLIALLTAVFILIGVLLVRQETQQHNQLKYDQVLASLNDMRESLTNRLYLNINKISAVSSLVAMNPDLTQQDFTRAIEVQFRGQHDLRNIGLARDLVIQFMYPMAGNEAAIGVDFKTLPNQIETVNQAIELNETILAGPVELVQGGIAIIARTPIMLLTL